MTDSPVDPVHDDHGPGEADDHDQDADPPTPFGEPPHPEDSDVEPRSLSTVSRDEPQPEEASNEATAPGVEASDDSTRIRRPGASCRARSATERPTRVTTSHDEDDQPIRARARATDDTAGKFQRDAGTWKLCG